MLPSFNELVLLLSYALVSLLIVSVKLEGVWYHELKMPGVQTDEEDAYVSVRFPLPNTDHVSYITEIIPKPNHSTAHHIILRGCVSSFVDHQTREQNIAYNCKYLIYAWAHGAPSLRLPPGIGIAVGPTAIIRAFELELHYLPKVTSPDQSGLALVLTNLSQPRVAGLFLLLRNSGTIRPGQKNFSLDISCRLPTGVSITLMAMRTHAHGLGRAVVGYRLPGGTRSPQLLGQGNPQWAQAFYSLRSLQAEFNSVDLYGGDVIIARCVYDSSERDVTTRIGSTHSDEMCNLYMLYHSSPQNLLSEHASYCDENAHPQLARIVLDQTPANVFLSGPAPSFVPNSVSDLLGNTNGRPTPTFGAPYFVPLKAPHLGQLSAIATLYTNNGHDLLLLHRGQNHWHDSSFDSNFIYRDRDAFISTNPLLVLDSKTLQLKYGWGAGQFVMPHGLTVQYHDGAQNPTAVFVTDVALHQVFKFDWGELNKPSLVLGTRFRPGTSNASFCQPADVVLSSTGDIFVADGYCNSRIVKFSSNGTYLNEWSSPGSGYQSKQCIHRQQAFADSEVMLPNGRWRATIPDALDAMSYSETTVLKADQSNECFAVVHSLTIIPSEDGSLEQVCAANREHAEIVCFTLDGQIVAHYGGSGLQTSVYAIQYSAKHRLLFATVSGSDMQAHGVLVNPLRPQNLVQLLSLPPGLDESSAISGFFDLPRIAVPHDLAFAPNDGSLYVVEIERTRLLRLDLRVNTSIEGSQIVSHNFLSATREWVSHWLTGSRLAGVIMLFLLTVLIVLIFCIRVCCYSSQSSLTLVRDKDIFISSRSGYANKPRRVGFRLLNQDGEGSDLDDSEDDQEDAILQRTRIGESISVRVDAENGQVGNKNTLAHLLAKSPDPLSRQPRALNKKAYSHVA